MTNRLRPLTSPSSLNISRHRSHSCREKATETVNDSDRQAIERIQRHFEQELAKSERELERVKYQQNEHRLSPIENIENIRIKLRNSYNQLMQEKIEKYINERYDEQSRISERKLRKLQNENEQFRLQSINKVVRERDAICEGKLAAQRSLYNRLLDEQARRLRAEQTLQSFENLNIEQLKDRLARVEHSNFELKHVIQNLMKQKPIYRSTVHIPNFGI